MYFNLKNKLIIFFILLKQINKNKFYVNCNNREIG